MKLNQMKVIDLSHTIHSDIPSWEGGCACILKNLSDYDDSNAKVKFRIQDISLPLGLGTHMDTPAHCFKDKKTASEIDITNPIYECVVIDVSEKSNANYLISKSDIKEFEKQFGFINENSIVLFRTGWAKYWHNQHKYRNNLQFPSISEESALYLNEKNIAGIGIDTLSPDTINSEFEVHQIMLGNNRFIIENVANLELLPSTGTYLMVLPLKIQNATESPLRLVALMGGQA
ncbi:cyclase family protein [Silvanigrella aquatica]|uniref:Cyclase n=1 Tax=Silvanigrella aquatica TaxID=1915309 RepID=A0A1L4D4L6_9BACT|nr:cyclase family protein [Silvanigrella aquatica]APJ05139.1 hypothetical protein AXG55_08735 [Silvanigrella aquatica]